MGFFSSFLHPPHQFKSESNLFESVNENNLYSLINSVVQMLSTLVILSVILTASALHHF